MISTLQVGRSALKLIMLGEATISGRGSMGCIKGDANFSEPSTRITREVWHRFGTWRLMEWELNIRCYLLSKYGIRYEALLPRILLLLQPIPNTLAAARSYLRLVTILLVFVEPWVDQVRT